MKKVAFASSLAFALSPVLAYAGGEVVPPPAPPPEPVPVAPVTETPPPPAPAPAPVEREGGLYGALYGGANFVDDSDFDVDTFDGEFSSEADFDTGFIVGGAVGYGFEMGGFQPRAELDVAYRRNGVDEVGFEDVSTSDVDGDVSAISGMANLWVDIAVTDNLKPYVGGGVGAAHISLDDVSIEGADLDDSDTVFAWQLGAGVAYEFTDSLAATVDYRWFNADDPKFDGDDGDFDAEYRAHSVMAGLRYTF